MLIKSISVGWLQANCYIVTDEKTMASAVIDPGDGLSEILDYLEGHSLNVKCILLTHGHFDHTGAAVGLHEETGAPIYIHAADLSKGDDPLKLTTKSDFVNCYKEGDSVNVGGLHFDVLETPGHTRGSVVLRCEDALFTGDTLFRDDCGRTDFADGNQEDMDRSLRRLYELDGDYEVYPGHEESTTLERERKFNISMLQAVSGKL